MPRISGGLLLCLLISLGLVACTSMDIGGPKASERDPRAGILAPQEGQPVAVLPEALNYTGLGTYTWPDGRSRTGNWLDGQLQGMGAEDAADERYTGQWIDDQRHGHGELVHRDGTRYVGDFVAGLAEGKGTQSADNGVYRGSWRAGNRHGQGQFNAADGSVYQGQWFDDQREGFGKVKFANGDEYAGEWSGGRRNGFGLIEYANGASYEGSWADGQRQGYGTWVSSADVSYEGTWRADSRHGYGREIRPDGSYFAGNWHEDKRHGAGFEAHPDGSTHSGQWQDDRIDGQGLRVTRAGISISGEWQQNTITEGSVELPNKASYQGDLFSLDGRSLDQAFYAWINKQAIASNPHGQYFLGIALLDFDEPARDTSAAKIWLGRAADAGVVEAQFRLASLLLDNDIPTALELLKRAAAADHPSANETLGEFFHTGQHLPQDFQAAIAHYQIAAAKGSIPATNNLAWLLATTRADNIADPQQALEIIRPLVLYLGNWQHLDTLAAANARLGNTERAVRLQKQAIIQAQSLAPDLVLDEMAARLDLYEQNQPYIE